MLKTKSLFERRRTRVRCSIKRSSRTRPRLSVFRSSKHIYAQVVDDIKGCTLASASSLDADFRQKLSKGSGVDAAAFVGQLVAVRAVKSGVTKVVFDRGAYLFHGRVKALADAAREKGLSF